MTRVASLYLPHLSIERLRRNERPRAQPERAAPGPLPVNDDPGECSVPRGGPWRPGARWARVDRSAVQDAADALPLHQQPSIREMGRRSEAAEHPFKRSLSNMRVAPEQASTAPTGFAPMVLVEQVGNRQLVAAACQAARASGAVPGMALTQARVLVPDLDVRAAEPVADLAWLDQLARHALRHWTPTAAVDAPAGLWLDLTGTAHLHGGEDRFCRRVRAFCHRLGFTTRLGLASTPGAAHALARHGQRTVDILPPGAEAQALAALPLACLRLTDEALTAASRFGLERVADLLPLPRGPLARRLGLKAVQRLDQALGRSPEPIVPVVAAEIVRVERSLLEPIGTADAIEQVIRDLLADLVARLVKRGVGVRALVLLLERVDGTEQRIAIGTVQATRDPTHLARLFHLRVERIDPGAGIERMRLAANRTEPLGAVALASRLAGEEAVPDMATLVDQLAGRIGPDGLFTVVPVESDVPERAMRRGPPLDGTGSWPAWKRPPRLLARPEPLSNVLALLPDHPPRRFTWRGVAHDVVAGDGPERIHGEWWRREGEVWGCRDYFRVEDTTGVRFWLFRRGDGVDGITGDLSWHMHGLFA
jgi:protein ImuB